LNNPDNRVHAYGSPLINQGSSSKSYANIYYSQPLGAEVVYSNRFKNYTVCSNGKWGKKCEGELPTRYQKVQSHFSYFNSNVEEC